MMEMNDYLCVFTKSSILELKCSCCEDEMPKDVFFSTATSAKVDGSGGPHPQRGPEERRKRE